MASYLLIFLRISWPQYVNSTAIFWEGLACSVDSWRDTFFGKHEHGALWLLICGAIEKKHLLTYLSTYLHIIRSDLAIKDSRRDCKVDRSIFSTLVIRRRQRCVLSLSLLQQLVIVIYGLYVGKESCVLIAFYFFSSFKTSYWGRGPPPRMSS